MLQKYSYFYYFNVRGLSVILELSLDNVRIFLIAHAQIKIII